MAEDTGSYDRLPLALAGMLAAFLAAGLAAARFAPTAASPPVGLPDLSSAQLVEIRDASGRAVLTGDFRERTDAQGNVEREAVLMDRRGRHAVGEVDIEIRTSGPMPMAQELEIDIVDLRPNATYSLYIDDTEIVVFTTDDRGAVDMDLHSASPNP